MDQGAQSDNKNEDVQIGARQRVQTQRGLEYWLQTLQKGFESAIRVWKKQTNKVESILADNGSIDVLQQER